MSERNAGTEQQQRASGRGSAGGSSGQQGGAQARSGPTGQGGAASGAAPHADRPEREQGVPVSRERAHGGRQTGASVQQGGGARGLSRGQPGGVPSFLTAPPDLIATAFLANPYDFMRRVTYEMDRLFEGGATSGARGGQQLQQGAGRQGAFQGGAGWSPSIEVSQRGDQLVVHADLPGVKRDDIHVELEDGALTLRGERRQQAGGREEGGVVHSERSYGLFERTIPLPEGVDAEQIQASFQDGVLEVTVPTPKPQSRSRKIEIR